MLLCEIGLLCRALYDKTEPHLAWVPRGLSGKRTERFEGNGCVRVLAGLPSGGSCSPEPFPPRKFGNDLPPHGSFGPSGHEPFACAAVLGFGPMVWLAMRSVDVAVRGRWRRRRRCRFHCYRALSRLRAASPLLLRPAPCLLRTAAALSTGLSAVGWLSPAARLLSIRSNARSLPILCKPRCVRGSLNFRWEVFQ